MPAMHERFRVAAGSRAGADTEARGAHGGPQVVPQLDLLVDGAREFGLHPERSQRTLVAAGRVEQELLVAEHTGLAEGAVAQLAGGAEAQPVGGHKVDGLGGIDAAVEAAMVCVGERDHKLTGVLQAGVHRDAVFDEAARGEHGDEVEEHVWLVGAQVWLARLEGGLKLRGCRGRHAIPTRRGWVRVCWTGRRGSWLRCGACAVDSSTGTATV